MTTTSQILLKCIQDMYWLIGAGWGNISILLLVQAQPLPPSDAAHAASSMHSLLQLPLNFHQSGLAFAAWLYCILSRTLRPRPDPYLLAPAEEGIAAMAASVSKYDEYLSFGAAHLVGQHHMLAPAPASFA